MELTAHYFKNYLRSIYKPKYDFNLVITNKTPKTRAGYYLVKRKKIVIHYVGTYDINELYNTAIHELAHHIHYTELHKRDNEERAHGKGDYDDEYKGHILSNKR